MTRSLDVRSVKHVGKGWLNREFILRSEMCHSWPREVDELDRRAV